MPDYATQLEKRGRHDAPAFPGVVVKSLLLIAALGAGEARASGPELGYQGSTRDYGRALEVNDPVSAANGAYHFSIPLFSLGGPMDLQCRLFYRSDLSRAGLELPEAFWLSPYASASTGMELGTGVYATVYLPDSRHVSFQRDTASNWLPTEVWVDLGWGTYTDNVPRIRCQLKETAAALYLADPAAGRLHIFQNYMTSSGTKYWRIGWTLDRNSNRLDFAYAGASVARPAGVSDGLGRSLAFSYLGWLTNIADHAGRSVGFYQEFSGADNGGVRTLRALTNAAGQGVRFSYGGSLDSLQHLITGLRKPAGNTPYTQAYASRTLNGVAFPRVVSQWDAFSNRYDMAYAAGSGEVTVSAPDGATNRYLHTSTHGPPASLTDAGGATVQFARDGSGQLAGVVDRLGGATAFDLDPASGLPAGAVNANGDVLAFTWAPAAQTFTHPTNGESVEMTFFDLARVDYPDGTQEEFQYDARGNRTGRTDRAGQVWTASFNERGQPTAVTNPAGGWIRYAYNPDGTVATAEDADGVATTYGYDALMRLNRITRGDGSSAAWGQDVLDRVTAWTNELGEVTRYEYDANGNVTGVTDPLGQAATFQYDLMDRLVAASNRSGGVLRFGYDNVGRLAGVTNPAGVALALDYDRHGRLAASRVGTAEWSYHHDAEGLLAGVTDPLGHAAGVARDALGNVTRITNAAGHETTLARDAMQRITARTDLLGRTWSYGYDAAGRLASVSVPAVPLPHAISNRYDAAGRLAGVMDLNTQEWTFAYTAAGRLQAVTDPLSNAWQTVYDESGRPAGGTLPDGTVWTNQYDAAGRATNRAWTGGPNLAYGYDANGRLTAADQVTLAYNPDGLVTGSVQAGQACAYSYDPAGRLTGVTYPGGLLSVAYTYDPTNGLLTGVSDTLTGTAIGFEYEAAFRPTAVRRPSGVDTEYTWDAAGQLTRIQDGTVLDLRYAYDSAGQTTQLVAQTPLAAAALLSSAVATQSVDAASQLADAPYGYDANGRLTNLPGMALAWDNAGRLVQAGAATLAHDGLGRPVRRIETGQTNGLVHSFANGLDGLLAERDENTGQWRRFYVWSPRGQLLYEIEAAAGNAVRHFHFDRGGNTRALTDAAGNVTDAYAYSPFGRLLGRTGTSDQPFLFLGQYGVRSEGTQSLYHARARYYDAETGRFLTREPLWPQIARPEMLNPYQYAGNNPADFTDPSGLDYGAGEAINNFFNALVIDAYEQNGLMGIVILYQDMFGVEFTRDVLEQENFWEVAGQVMRDCDREIRKRRAEQRIWAEIMERDRQLFAAQETETTESPGRPRRTTLFYMDPAVGAEPPLPAPRDSTGYYVTADLLVLHTGPREAPAKARQTIFSNPDQAAPAMIGGLADLFGLMIQMRIIAPDPAEADALMAKLLAQYGGNINAVKWDLEQKFDRWRDKGWVWAGHQ